MTKNGDSSEDATPPVERVRVGRFEWERLMVSSSLPRPTKTILAMLAMFMSENGGDARPGRNAMEIVTGRGKSVVSEHLRVAIDAGYLIEVERGGFRGTTTRASEYAAAVPKPVFDTREAILAAPPWKRPRDTRSSGKPEVRAIDEAPENRTFAQDQGPVLQDQGPVFGDERPEIRTPPRTYTTHPHHPGPKNGEGESSKTEEPNPDADYVRTIQALRPDWTARLVLAAISKAEDDGRDPAHCREALLRLAGSEYSDTRLPNRLAEAGPWWAAVVPPKIRSVGGGKCPKHPDRPVDCRKCEREKPRCAHGFAGGSELRQIDGLPRCPNCRSIARAVGEAMAA